MDQVLAYRRRVTAAAGGEGHLCQQVAAFTELVQVGDGGQRIADAAHPRRHVCALIKRAAGCDDPWSRTVTSHRASFTAVLVCQARAAAHGRVATQRFADPVAMTLLTESERVVVRQVRDRTPPQGSVRLTYERVRGASVVLVPRTVAIDDAVRAAYAPQMVVVGAGLDTRAWRMPGLSNVDVFEVDHPATQQDERAP